MSYLDIPLLLVLMFTQEMALWKYKTCLRTAILIFLSPLLY